MQRPLQTTETVVSAIDFDGLLASATYLNKMKDLILGAASDGRGLNEKDYDDLAKTIVEAYPEYFNKFIPNKEKEHVISIGTNRQYEYADMENGKFKRPGEAPTLSCFPFYAALVKQLNLRYPQDPPIELDTFILEDVARGLKPGTSFERLSKKMPSKEIVKKMNDFMDLTEEAAKKQMVTMNNELNDEFFKKDENALPMNQSLVPSDHFKFVHLFEQMQRLRRNPKYDGKKITYTLDDDRKDILEGAEKIYQENKELIPQGITLGFRQFLPPDAEYHAVREESERKGIFLVDKMPNDNKPYENKFIILSGAPYQIYFVEDGNAKLAASYYSDSKKFDIQKGFEAKLSPDMTFALSSLILSDQMFGSYKTAQIEAQNPIALDFDDIAVTKSLIKMMHQFDLNADRFLQDNPLDTKEKATYQSLTSKMQAFIEANNLRAAFEKQYQYSDLTPAAPNNELNKPDSTLPELCAEQATAYINQRKLFSFGRKAYTSGDVQQAFRDIYNLKKKQDGETVQISFYDIYKELISYERVPALFDIKSKERINLYQNIVFDVTSNASGNVSIRFAPDENAQKKFKFSLEALQASEKPTPKQSVVDLPELRTALPEPNRDNLLVYLKTSLESIRDDLKALGHTKHIEHIEKLINRVKNETDVAKVMMAIELAYKVEKEHTLNPRFLSFSSKATQTKHPFENKLNNDPQNHHYTRMLGMLLQTAYVHEAPQSKFVNREDIGHINPQETKTGAYDKYVSGLGAGIKGYKNIEANLKDNGFKPVQIYRFYKFENEKFDVNWAKKIFPELKKEYKLSDEKIATLLNANDADAAKKLEVYKGKNGVNELNQIIVKLHQVKDNIGELKALASQPAPVYQKV